MMTKVYPDTHIPAVHGFSDTFYHPNDWRQGNASYLEASRAGRPNVQRRMAEVLSQLGPQIDRVDQDFAAKHGWTPNPAARQWAKPAYQQYQADLGKVTAGTPPKPWNDVGRQFHPELMQMAAASSERSRSLAPQHGIKACRDRSASGLRRRA